MPSIFATHRSKVNVARHPRTRSHGTTGQPTQRERTKASGRLLNAGLALIYAVMFLLAYIRFLNPTFAYLGYAYYAPDTAFLVASLLISIAPVFCYRGYQALSSAISVLIYVLLYVPVVLTFAVGTRLPQTEIALCQLTFMSSMCLLFFADAIRLKSPFALRGKLRLSSGVLAVTLLSSAYVLFIYRGNLRFVSFGDAVYEHRSVNADLGGDVLTRYLSAWLLTAFIPICLTVGLYERRIRYFLAGTAACIVIYTATAAKVAILLPAVMGGLYVLVKGRGLGALYPRFVGALAAGIAILLPVTVAAEGGIVYTAGSVLLLRTIGNGGQLTSAYYEFFSQYPQTLYSHLNIVNAVTRSYPYGEFGLGNVIGRYFWRDDVNANANFWATDGIAALGLPGVFVATALCMILFVAMNSVTRRFDPRYTFLAFVPFTMSLLNTSLFSSLLSGGGALLLLYFSFTAGATPHDGGTSTVVRFQRSSRVP